MAQKKHLHALRQGAQAWNLWRKKNPGVKPDLAEADLREWDLREAELSAADFRGADLTGGAMSGAILNWADLGKAKLAQADLRGGHLHRSDLKWASLCRGDFRRADLSRADLCEADLTEANLTEVDLSGANLGGANLKWANLNKANLSGANLTRANLSGAALQGAHLSGANLNWADMSGAYLECANLMNASLGEANLQEAVLTDCRVYGVCTWGLDLSKTEQSNLIFTPLGEPAVGVDDLEIAQFLYSLLYSEKIRTLMDSPGNRIVLLLGKFSAHRKAILKALKEELRRQGYWPVVFDTEGSLGRDLARPLSVLAGLSRFIIADLSEPPSMPQELREIVIRLPSVPVQPLQQEDSPDYALFRAFRNFPWVLQTHRYTDLDDLLPSLGNKVVQPAQKMAQELRRRSGGQDEEGAQKVAERKATGRGEKGGA